MSRTYPWLTAILSLALSTASARAAERPQPKPAEADLAALVDTIRDNRTALVAVNLDLSQEEAAKFWPLYDRYRQAINEPSDRMVAIVADYTEHFHDLSNDKALQLVRDYLAAESDRLKVRVSYVDEFAKILPGRTVARFYQIENKMDAVLRYDLAATIPVVEQQRGAPAQ